MVGFGWLISTALSLSLIFGLYPIVKKGEALSINVAAFYNAVSRPLWCVSLAWITIACVNGYGGKTIIRFRNFLLSHLNQFKLYMCYEFVILFISIYHLILFRVYLLC